jgi:hypothetical protein
MKITQDRHHIVTPAHLGVVRRKKVRHGTILKCEKRLFRRTGQSHFAPQQF